jgi:hypothetical protein
MYVLMQITRWLEMAKATATVSRTNPVAPLPLFNIKVSKYRCIDKVIWNNWCMSWQMSCAITGQNVWLTPLNVIECKYCCILSKWFKIKFVVSCGLLTQPPVTSSAVASFQHQRE